MSSIPTASSTALFQALSNQIAKFNLPLIAQVDGKAAHLIGTGFLLRVGGRSYVGSARHVFDELYPGGVSVLPKQNAHSLFTGVGPGPLTPLSGELALSTEPSTDLGLLLLSNSKLRWPNSKNRALDLTPGHLRPVPGCKTAERFCFAGFPATGFARASGGVQIGGAHVTCREADSGLYQRLELTPREHLILEFDQRQAEEVNGKLRRPPKPQGMSGARVWEVFRHERGGFRLAAVAVATRHEKGHRAVVCTRVVSFRPLLEEFQVDVSAWPAPG